MKSDIELQVVDLSRGGAGVANAADGKVVFIPWTAPGDRVSVRILYEKRRYAQAEIIEILEASSIRQTPPCPVFGICGGCQWQHLPYTLQWETKVKGVFDSLRRVGVHLPHRVDQIPATQVWEYRNRIQLRGLGSQIGFFKPASRSLVPIDRCWIARTEINQGWEQIRLEGSRLKIPYKVEVEVLSQGEIKRTWNSKHAAGGFRQVHDAQNQQLQDWMIQVIPKAHCLYDLFGGNGNLSSRLADQMKEIHCVDLSAPQLPPPGTPGNLQFYRQSVVPWLLNRCAQQTSITGGAAILDPPREGLGSDLTPIATALHTLKVTHLVQVGCDSDSWARDVACWIKRGWTVQKMMMIDLFPQTSHIECAALLDRQ